MKKILFKALAMIMLGISILISSFKIGFTGYTAELMFQAIALAFLMLDFVKTDLKK